MEFVSTQKYLRISPKKVRVVVGTIKSLRPARAVEILPFVAQRGSFYLEKVIKTAIANAAQKGVQPEDLYIKEIQILEGPRRKTGTPVSKGRWHPILKRMSHIRVVLETRDLEKPKQEEKKEEVKVSVPKKVQKEVKKKAKKTKKLK